MDNFRRSNVSLSHVNQSHLASPSRVPSVYESRSRYESAQVDLLLYLKWVILLIGTIVGILFLKALLGAPPAGRCAVSAEPLKSRLRGYFSQGARPAAPRAPAAAAPSLEGIWSYFLPSWGFSELGSIQERIREQRFSVKPALPELPSAESIRADPARFNLSLAQLGETAVERLRAEFPAARVLGGLHALIGGAELGADAGAEELERSRAELSAQLRRLGELERLLQQNTTADVVLKLNDLRGSAQALTAKRAQLNELRGRFLVAERALTVCEGREREHDQSLAADRALAGELREKLAALEQTAAELRQRIEEKEKSLSENDRQNRERIVALTSRGAQLKASLARRPAIEQSIAEKRRRGQQLAAELARQRARLAALLEQRQTLDAEFQHFMAQPRELQEELGGLEAKKKILTMRLNSLITHRQIKTFLGTLVPAKEKKSTLESILDEKLSEEKELLETMERYGREGGVVPDVPDNLKRQIERDESNFQAILQKYSEWQKVVEDYDGSDEDITVVQVQLREGDERVRGLQARISEFKGRQNAFAERLRGLDTHIAAARAALAEGEAEEKGGAEWAAQAEKDVAEWQQAWQTLQGEIAARNSEFIAYKANVEQSFGDLDKQRESAGGVLELHRAQLREVEQRLKARGDQLAAAHAECTTTKALYVKVAQMVAPLQTLLAHDAHAVEQLKRDLAGIIEPYTLLPS